MSEPKKFSSLSLALDAVLMLGAFTVFYHILQPHVQSADPFRIRLVAAAAASCLTGVAWLAWQCGKVVYRAQRAARK
jgi:hypothetical protein